MINKSAIEEAVSRHEKIAFQFSGGRDSVAALYVMRPWWSCLTAYFLDSGDPFPETLAIVDRVSSELPITVVRSDVKRYHAEVAWPADVVPVDNTPIGQLVSGRAQTLTSRYQCCWDNKMRPLHQRMLDDGITLIVRGQREEDYARAPARSGDVDGGIELLFPIESWSTAEVNAYCRDNDLPMAPWYAEGASHGSDCMHCSAWLDDGRMPYLKKHHPQVYRAVRKRLGVIRAEIERQLPPKDNE